MQLFSLWSEKKIWKIFNLGFIKNTRKKVLWADSCPSCWSSDYSQWSRRTKICFYQFFFLQKKNFLLRSQKFSGIVAPKKSFFPKWIQDHFFFKRSRLLCFILAFKRILGQLDFFLKENERKYKGILQLQKNWFFRTIWRIPFIISQMTILPPL